MPLDDGIPIFNFKPCCLDGLHLQGSISHVNSSQSCYSSVEEIVDFIIFHSYNSQRGHGLDLWRHFYYKTIQKECETIITLSKDCISPFYTTAMKQINHNQRQGWDQLWTDLSFSLSVFFVTSSLICIELWRKHVSLNSLRRNKLSSAHAHSRQIALSSAFLFSEDWESDPRGKSYEARGLIVLFNSRVITISLRLAMQTNYW